MKKISLYCLLCSVMLTFVGCKKDNVIVDRLPATISNYQGPNDEKVYINTDKYACWHVGDAVKLNGYNASVQVNQVNESNYYYIDVTSNMRANSYYAIFPASAVTNASNYSVYLDPVQVYEVDEDGNQKVNALMAAYGTTRLEFKNICALLKVQVRNIPANDDDYNYYLTKIEVSVTGNDVIAGEGQITFPQIGSDGQPSGAPTLSMSSSGTKTIKLQFDGNDNGNGDYYITVPPVTGKFEVKVHYVQVNKSSGDRLFKSETFTQTSTGTLQANFIGAVNASRTNPVVEEHLPGAFTTNSGVVYFSRGALRCYNSVPTSNESNPSWTFENDQLTVAAYNYDGPSTGIFRESDYLPWSTDQEHAGFPIIDNHAGGTFWDWGQHFVTSSHWETLSQSDWNVLMNSRNASKLNNVLNAHYAYAKVNNQVGAILFPDLFSWPTTVSSTKIPSTINGKLSSWNDAPSYSLPEWKELEDAGCVFLPAKGYYSFSGNTGRFSNDQEGYYWTSTKNDNKTAYYLGFSTSADPNTSSSIKFGNGLMVRLVYK